MLRQTNSNSGIVTTQYLRQFEADTSSTLCMHTRGGAEVLFPPPCQHSLLSPNHRSTPQHPHCIHLAILPDALPEQPQSLCADGIMCLVGLMVVAVLDAHQLNLSALQDGEGQDTVRERGGSTA